MRGVLRRVGLVPVLVAAALAASARADAADCAPASGLSTCIDSDNLWLHSGGGPFLSLGPGTTVAPGTLGFGLVVSYLSRPIGLRIASPDPNGTVVHAVDDAVDATFLWSLGLTDRFELSLAAPVALYQNGAGLGDVLGDSSRPSRSALRDMRVGATYAILARPRVGPPDGTSLLARFEFGLPTGDATSFAGTGAMTLAPSLVLDHKRGRFELSLEAGARLRPARELAGSRIGSQLFGAAGVAFDVIPKRRLLTVGAEAFALYGLGGDLTTGPDRGQPSTRVIPAEWMATATSAPFLGGDLSFVLAGGGPLPLTTDSSVTAPRFRLDFGVRYAPQGHDEDGDGVLDRDDQCPSAREDHDGFQDQDGCPDPDNDGDGIPDARDRCRDAPEDFDGHDDDDGCPDLDDDGDGVPDAADKCRNEPEDRDGYQDDDGCPDPDNDGDGIPDVKDRCPSGAEDKDGFKDDDGCPDPDNDLDGIPDAADECPNAAEDKDGFEDDDGCPDPDNDHDGVPDATDQCPNEPETIDGVDDDDGCPEPGAHTSVRWDHDRVVLPRPARFAPGSAVLTPDLSKLVKMAAALARTRALVQIVIVEAYGDRPRDESPRALELAANRAAAVKAALVAEGLPEAAITAAAGDLAAARPAGASQLDITVRGATTTRARAAGPAK